MPTKIVTFSMDEQVIKALEDVSKYTHNTKSGTLAWLIVKEHRRQLALREEGGFADQ